MRKIVIGIVIVCLYCFPFVYFSMDQDFANRSMLGNLLMIVMTSLFAFWGKFLCNSIPFIIGNIVSAGWRTRLSVLNLIPQLFAMKLANGHKNKGKD